YAPPCSLHSFPTRRSSDLLFDDLRRNAARDDLVSRRQNNRIAFDAERPAEDEKSVLLEITLRIGVRLVDEDPRFAVRGHRSSKRSEEHTSELQSRFDLVCR